MTVDRGGSAVHLTDLRRVYGGVAALDGLTLHIEPGEFVALLGPSGCGKTTALRCLAGLEDPDSGSVEVGGRDLTRVPTNKRDMGMVFQAYSLFPHMTARQNVEFGLEMRNRDRAVRRARTDETLDLVGLGAHAEKYAHQLSGTSSPVGSNSGWHLPGRSRSSRRSCSSTSRCPRSMPRCAASCATRSAASSSRSARRRSS